MCPSHESSGQAIEPKQAPQLRDGFRGRGTYPSPSPMPNLADA
jgi:hypothetical protein